MRVAERQAGPRGAQVWWEGPFQLHQGPSWQHRVRSAAEMRALAVKRHVLLWQLRGVANTRGPSGHLHAC